jgi:hypothetical protein
VLGVEAHSVRVATRRSPGGQLVPIKRDRPAAEGDVVIGDPSVGDRSAFIGAVRDALDGTEASPSTTSVERIDG